MPDETISELLDSFEQYLATSTELSPRSRDIYLQAMRLCAEELGDPLLDDLTPQALLDWHSACLARGLRHETVASRRKALRHFLIWVDEVLEDPQGPRLMRILRRMKSPPEAKTLSREAHTISQITFQKLLAGAGSTVYGKRDRAMLHFLWDTGVRRNELVTLRLEDLDLLHQRAKVTGKGNKQRVVAFTRSCQEDLQAWLGLRQTWRIEADTLFLNYDGRRFHPNTIGAMLKGWARRGKVKEEIWPHLFRHTRVTDLVTQKGVAFAARFAGHANINTTMGYFHQDIGDLQTGYNEAMGEEPEEEGTE